MENACEVRPEFEIFQFWLIVPCLASETFLQVLVLADLHNTTQLKLHVLKFINDRRVAEVRVDSIYCIQENVIAGDGDRWVAANACRTFTSGWRGLQVTRIICESCRRSVYIEVRLFQVVQATIHLLFLK